MLESHVTDCQHLGRSLLLLLLSGPTRCCICKAIFSGWRYMERRLKRTRLTYAYAIALSIPNADRQHEGTSGVLN